MQKVYKESKLFYQSMIIFVEDILLVPIVFDDHVRVKSVAFFDADFNLLSCECDNFIFTLRY